MSNFVQLRELKIQQDDAIRMYWRDVQEAAGTILQGFSDYLQLPEETYSGENGPCGYVKLGKLVNGKQKEVSLHELDGENSWLAFSVGLTVDKAVNTYPKSTVYTNLKLKKVAGGYQVSFVDHEVTINVPVVDGKADFSSVHEQIFQGLCKYFNYRP